MSINLSRPALIAVICIGIWLVPATVAAQEMTVALGVPELSTGRILITVPVTVSCPPFDPSLTHFGTTVGIEVRQASGQKIAFGTGHASGHLPDLLFPCDGAEYTVVVSLVANESGPPFHGGPAVLTAFASAEAGTPCFPGSTTCFFNVTGQSATAGPTVLNLR